MLRTLYISRKPKTNFHFRKKKKQKRKELGCGWVCVCHLRGKIKNVKANPTSVIDIRVIDWRGKGHTWRLKWVPKSF